MHGAHRDWLVSLGGNVYDEPERRYTRTRRSTGLDAKGGREGWWRGIVVNGERYCVGLAADWEVLAPGRVGVKAPCFAPVGGEAEGVGLAGLEGVFPEWCGGVDTEADTGLAPGG